MERSEGISWKLGDFGERREGEGCRDEGFIEIVIDGGVS